MYPSTRKGTKECMVGIGVALFRYGTLTACRKALSAVLGGTPWLDGRSRSDIMECGMQVARAGLLLQKKEGIPAFVARNLDVVMKSWNRAYKRTWVKTKTENVRSQMKLQRGRDEPIVFYLVSSHQKPQPAHEPLQGKVLVDYYWKSTLGDDARVPSVERYVKAKKVHTVQWAMGAPHYLISRVNCKHVLYPLRTDDVLNMNLKAIKNKYQPKVTGVHRPISDAQRWEDYKKLCQDVFAETERRIG